MKSLLTLTIAALVGGGIAASGTAALADWPSASDRVTLVVPFDTGGSNDRMARHMAPHLSRHLNGAPVTVVNRPGASGAVGSSWFLNQPDDGSHFLIQMGVPFLANNILLSDLPMEWEDFEPINIQWLQSTMLFVGNDTGFETLPELFEAIRENPGEYSSSTIFGSGGHLQMLLMLEAAGIPADNVRWVTFDGGGPQRSAVAGGTVTFALTSATGSLGIADLITPLAIHAEDGDENWPGVPYINDVMQAEYGATVPGVANTFAGLFARASFRENHPERFEAFVNAYREMIESEEFQASAAEAGIGAQWFGPERSKAILDEGFETMSQHADAFED